MRLVCDGRKHNKRSVTYSPTPSREELFILLHIFAKNGWNYYHVDEIRAFLNAPSQDTRDVFTKFSGNPDFWRIDKAQYGKKDACRDYTDHVRNRLVNKMECTQLQLCECIFLKRIDEHRISSWVEITIRSHFNL